MLTFLHFNSLISLLINLKKQIRLTSKSSLVCLFVFNQSTKCTLNILWSLSIQQCTCTLMIWKLDHLNDLTESISSFLITIWSHTLWSKTDNPSVLILVNRYTVSVCIESLVPIISTRTCSYWCQSGIVIYKILSATKCSGLMDRASQWSVTFNPCVKIVSMTTSS